jgi:hypothetical protein
MARGDGKRERGLMSNRRKVNIRKEDSTLAWLTGDDNPPVKYLTLKNLLDTPESRLKRARNKINDYPVIRGILKHHKTFWGKDTHLYRKYKGGYWNLIFLGDLFADGRDKLIREGVEFLLADNLWHKRIDECSTNWICLSSNITRAMAALGYADDPRVRTHTEDIAASIVKNDGIVCTVMDYSLLPQCYMALPKVLMALGSYAGKKRIVRQATKIASEKLLESHIYRYIPEYQDEWNENYDTLSKRLKATKSKKNGDTLKKHLAAIRPGILKRNRSFKPKQGWLKFGYPLHYNSDILEAMRSMADAGIKYDKRMDDALDVIEKNRLPDCTWKLGFSLNGKMWIDIEKRGRPSKWVTYHALRVLTTYRRINYDF